MRACVFARAAERTERKKSEEAKAENKRESAWPVGPGESLSKAT